jgi:SAM-dependent methyltransferase
MIKKELKTQKTYDYQTSGKFKDVEEIIVSTPFDYSKKINIEKDFFKNKLILDVGCGAGRYTRILADWKARGVIGIDLSKGSIEKAKKETKNKKAKYLNMSVYEIDVNKWKEKFDYILFTGCLMHMRDPNEAVKIVSNVLKRDGIISFWVYEKQNAIKEFNTKSLRLVTTRLPYSGLEFVSHIATSIDRIPIIRKFFNMIINISPRYVDNIDTLNVPFYHRFSEEKLKTILVNNGIQSVAVNYFCVNHGLKKLVHGKYGGGFGIKGQKYRNIC